jgi:hypothetical protein
MAAIKYTLSTETRRRAPSIEAEAEWLSREGSLWYELNVEPQRATIGDLVYFIRAGEMVARARITDCTWKDASEMGGSYTGVETTTSCNRFEIRKMELAKRPLPHQGFQGFQYVTDKELPAFESAFKIRRRNRT